MAKKNISVSVKIKDLERSKVNVLNISEERTLPKYALWVKINLIVLSIYYYSPVNSSVLEICLHIKLQTY